MNSTPSRSKRLMNNIVASFFVKGWSSVVVLLMVPLTLCCLGEYQNGVWLTISSMLVWIDQMDIGLGNGLRNSLATLIAKGKVDEARQVVSSTLTMLCCIVIPVMVVLCIAIWYTDVFSFLNVDEAVIPDLRIALLIAVILVCITFVLKFIGNVYMGMQLPAVSNLIITLGQTLALLGTWLLLKTDNVSFLSVVIVNVISPLIVYLLAYPYTFYIKYSELRPSLDCVNIKIAIQLGNVGLKFFWLQIAGVIQFMTANILISKFFTPAMVTPYQISYRYMSLAMVVFSVVCMPFWNATTDAYSRGDMDWIRTANKHMNRTTIVIALGLLVMILVSPWVYDVWIGNKSHVPLKMTIMMALYIFLLILSMRYSYFLNGIGALRLQMYMTVMTIVFIPLAWGVSYITHSIIWFMGVMGFCIAPSILVNMIQFRKIMQNKATGIWKI